MAFLWHELRSAIPLVAGGDAYILALTWLTIRVAAFSTAAALVIGLPIGLTIGLVGSAAGARSTSWPTRASRCPRSSSAWRSCC